MAYFQTDNLWVNQLADGVADLVLDVAGSKINGLRPSVLDDLDRALDRVAEDTSFRLLLLRTAKAASFCTGLAPSELVETSATGLGEIATAGQRLCTKLADLRLPSVAVVSGGCLGGGLELALACDYRVAVSKPTTVFSFTELELGLMPLWGGTQRLPKVIGLERALQMLLGGRRLGVREAGAWGLVDAIVGPSDTSPPRLPYTHQPGKRFLPFLPYKTWRQWLSESTRLGRSLIFRGAERVLRRRLPDDMPAPKHALEAIKTGLRVGTEGGLARVREAIVELAKSEACRNLLRLHVQRDSLRAVSAENQQARRRSVGVIGGGRRTTALLHLLLTKGYQAVIHEASDAALGAVLYQMLSIFQHEVASGALTQADLTQLLRNLRGTTAWKGFDQVDLVLDTSDEPSRTASSFKELDKETAPQTILVATAPGLRVADIQGKENGSRIAGLQMLAPVNRSLLVEVICSDKMGADITRRLSDFVVSLGRVPWPVPDRPGLLIERLLLPYLNEATLLVKEGLDPRRVDEAMVRFGAAYGPLEFLDLVGMDVVERLVEQLAPAVAPRIIFNDAFAFLTKSKWLGQKTGAGFYRYRRKKRRVNQQAVAHLRGRSHAEAPHTMEAMSRADQLAWAKQRLALLVINEAAWCLEEGRANSADSVDLAVMLIGWAPHRGGPLHYAQHLGLATVIAELEELAAQYGARYQPCPALDRLSRTPTETEPQDFVS